MRAIALTPLALTLAAMTSLINVASCQASSYYAGYFYRTYAGWGPYGIKATISTINPTVPSGHGHFQFATVVLSYARGYYIQLGYNSRPPTNGLRFHYEFFDANHQIHAEIGPTPIVGQDYLYCVVSLYEKQDYTLIISKLLGNGQLEEVYRLVVTANPYLAEDIEAFAKTTTTSICLDGSHFRSLKYYYSGRPWPLWSRHVPMVSAPYQLNQISHSEFTASGGG